MRLGQIVNNILAEKKSEAFGPNGRREQRFDVRAPLMIRVLDANDSPQAPFRVWLRNFSANGCCVVSQQRINAGQRFLLRLPRPENDGEIEFCYTAVRCNMVADDVFHVGCKRIEVPQLRPGKASKTVPVKLPPKIENEAERIRSAMFDR